MISFAANGDGSIRCVAHATQVCGNGVIEGTEQCDDGNTVNGDGCDAACHLEAPPPPPCGDGVRSAPEQCDDGNNTNLDGCDSTCHFEQSLRINSLTLPFTTAPACPANAIGGAIVGTIVRTNVQSSIDNNVQTGALSVLFKLGNLDDLTGIADPTVTIGVMKGLPVAGAGYDGRNDLDWWYSAASSDIDALRRPLFVLPGAIDASRTKAGPGSVMMPLPLAGLPTDLRMSSVQLTFDNGVVSTPLMSPAAQPPGHLASEHLDPLLTSFSTATEGSICGGASAASLAMVAVPPALVGCGSSLACSECFTATNSLLDVLVTGCTLIGGVQQVRATHPDTADPLAPPAGAGAPYRLQTNASHVVSACLDRDNSLVPLNACLNAAAYSMFLQFTADRVIVK